MPYIEVESPDKSINIALWKISEAERFFYDRLNLFANEVKLLKKMSDSNRRLQWLASRLSLKEMLDIRHKVESLNLATGEPFLTDYSNFISFSHSFPIAGVIASENHRVSIDIEVINSRKSDEITRKFLNDTELAFYQQNKSWRLFYLLWSSKETLYKIYALKEVTLKNNLTLHCENYIDESEGSFVGTVKKGDFHKKYRVFYKFFENFVVTFTTDYFD